MYSTHTHLPFVIKVRFVFETERSTTKKGRLLPSFFLCGGAGEPRARGKRTTKPRSKGAGSRGTPRRGVPLRGVSAEPCCPHHKKKEGFCLLFFVRRRRRTSRPREKNDETAEQGRRVARNAPPRGPPSGGVGGALLSPPQKKGRLLPSFFCAEAQANLAPAGIERRNRGAGRRVARNAPPRGPPSGVSAEPCCPHRKNDPDRALLRQSVQVVFSAKSVPLFR